MNILITKKILPTAITKKNDAIQHLMKILQREPYGINVAYSIMA